MAASSQEIMEPVVLETWLNHYKLGEFFFLYDLGKDPSESLYLSLQTLMDLPLKKDFIQPWRHQEIIPLQALAPAIQAKLDMLSLRLSLSVKPEILQPQIISVRPQPSKKIIKFMDSARYSGFVNYAFNGQWNTSAVAVEKTFSIPWELGFKAYQWFFSSKFLYQHSSQQRSLRRFITNAVWDRKDTMQRLMVGDFYPSVNIASGAQVVGGLSWRSYYESQPQYRYHPELTLRQLMPLPADMTVFVNQNQIDTWHLKPGSVVLRDLINSTGQGLVQLKFKDVFGYESEHRYPYLISTDLLKPTVQTYEYNIGLRREGMGQNNGRYQGWLVSGNHRYGFSNTITGGLRFELTQ
ncbi:fimbria/pilus outer membrane usher protein, partial [Candidatus Venteria ishoeyi]|uniref:hypothetical protein n=1 Tax=Candidatus Venteria ishoeyi TaxID=1899563 RepID=UPI0015A9B5C4